MLLGYLSLDSILQAIGGSGAFAVATAMIKDVYDSKSRVPILAKVQSMALISSASAPVLGALLLKFMSWGVFLALAFIGLLALAGSIALQETIANATRARCYRHWGGYAKLQGIQAFRLCSFCFRC